MRECCARGLDTFDLGIGEAHYKSLFCSDAEPLFDSFLPLTRGGRFVALGARLAEACKRAIKQQPLLWSAVRALRRLRARTAAR